MKRLVGLIAVAAFILNGCSQELEVKTVDSITTEYGEELENSKLFDAKESDENVTVKTIDGFDDKKLGEQELTVTFTDGEKETEKTIKVKVEDTRNPVIELKKETITITVGDKLTLKDNVKSVSDPIDGELKYSSKQIEKSGYYIDTGKLDTDKVGTYEVKILAYDANENAAEKTFKVVVEKKKETKKETSNTTSQNRTTPVTSGSSRNSTGSTGSSSNVGNSSSASNGGQSSNTSGNESTVLCPNGRYPEKACDVIISVPTVGSDGIYYNTEDEAWTVGDTKGMAGEISGFNVYKVTFNDGSEKWIWISHEDLGYSK
ncbi:flagellar biosynthesis protein FlgM [Erysipelotrichaceae bacterium HCN-30851]